MYEKCIKCDRIGLSCVPNLMTLPFPDLIQWCDKRQKYLGWTNQILADRSKVPVGTINRIKQGDYSDCKYSTIRSILIALIGGTTDEFPCNAQVEKELQQTESLEKENAELKLHLERIDEQHRADIRAIIAEHKEEVAFLKDELKAWRSLHQKRSDGDIG
jgi:hypothetical protein